MRRLSLAVEDRHNLKLVLAFDSFLVSLSEVCTRGTEETSLVTIDRRILHFRFDDGETCKEEFQLQSQNFFYLLAIVLTSEVPKNGPNEQFIILHGVKQCIFRNLNNSS